MTSDLGQEEAIPVNRFHPEALSKVPKGWMLRDCSQYYNEYKLCKSAKSKFYMIYVDGETSSCEHWKQNFTDCNRWIDQSDVSAAERVISREEERIKKRLKGHFENDVWERRSGGPPREWNASLPQHLVNASEHSYLKSLKDEDQSYNRHGRLLGAKLATAIPQCTIL